jgi:hypothetical protein
VFCFRDGRMDVYVNVGKPEKYRLDAIEFTPQVDSFLRRLASENID